MTKVPATKKLQKIPSKKALWLFSGSDQLTRVSDKTPKNPKYIDKEIVNLKKDLIRSRFLIQCVKIGRGYFNILREENAMKKKQQQLQKLQEEELNKFQPAKKFSDIHCGDNLLSTYDYEKLKKLEAGIIIRPFTPIHSCLAAPTLPESHVDPLFRQLCALHWLLEALTIDHTHHTMRPLIACWNPKDPGGSKSTIKKINKDKSMGQRWDHFVTAPKTKKYKAPAIRTAIASRKPSRRGSTLSLSRTSGGSSPQSSMMSVNPSSDEPVGSKDIEDNESSSTKPEEEILHLYLQKLLEMVREDARRTILVENEIQKKAPSILSLVKQIKSEYGWKEWQTTHKSSERSSTTSGESHIQVIQKKSKSRANRDIIYCKTGVCNNMRAKFFSVAQEAGFCLQDKMEILRKRQEERGLQKFHSFIVTSNFQKDITKMRHQVSIVKGDAEEIADHWYFDLLSKLPEDLKSFRPARKILTKLQKFGENLDLRIRPHVLLKVLQDLRVWELCSPDIAVAIEFVREHIIHMPQEDYINWLQSRVNVPFRQRTILT
ncbi:coiled-coil domain-containing protein 60 isoform X2 [Mus pahari]|uniref:coiled-coil domain-containing protein 60 isoform X2 n=1 Tax=Mus pahari TaxID=10093 RepID=UPI000A30EDE8|nr:coiled-coil domain-containing protein 60 isoform X2 [Mus pahari]